MRAVTFHGKQDFRADNVRDPKIEQPTDAIVRITSTAICGSDLHLYGVLTMFMEEGDIIGHEPRTATKSSRRSRTARSSALQP